MTDGDCQGVGSVCLGDLRQVEKHLHHVLDLLLGRFAMADNSLFYLQGTVFGDRQSGVYPGNDGRSSCLPQLQGALDIGGEKNILYGDRIRPVAVNDGTEIIKDLFEPSREISSLVGEDGAIVDMNKAVAVLANDAVTGNA